MTTLRCTTQLRRRLRASDGPDVPPVSGLGDWYAKIAVTRPKHLVVCTNERTLLTVVVALSPQDSFVARFAAAAGQVIQRIPARADIIDREISRLGDTRIGRATNRSTLASLNQFTYSIEAWLANRPLGDLHALSLWLCDTPCSPLSTHWPWLEAELVLTGAVAPGRKSFKFSEHAT